MPEKHVELRAQLEASREEIRTLSEKPELDEAEETRLSELVEGFKEVEARTKVAETRAAEVERIRSVATAAKGVDAAPGQINKRSAFDGDTRSASTGEIRDRAMRAIEERGHHLNARQKDGLDRLLNTRNSNTSGTQVAERLLLTESDAYRSAFAKAMQQNQPILTAEENDAVLRFRAFEARANEGTPSAGGYGVPVLIDPSIILTSGAADAPVLDLMRKIQITTNNWKGVSSDGVTWAYQAEAAVVADNTPTLAQPSIPVYTARGFIPYTLEVEQDYPGFEQEMSNVLSQGYVNLLASKTMTGSGSSEPKGIFTAIAAASGHVVVTTAGTLGAVDVRKAWAALPERFRSRATYVMNTSVENQVRAWGNNLALADYTDNMLATGVSTLTGRPIVLTDYAPNFTGQTTTFSYLVVGDFSHFLLIQRAGITLELVPHLFDTSTGRPIGERGWFAFARHGYDVDSTNAFRVVTNN